MDKFKNLFTDEEIIEEEEEVVEIKEVKKEEEPPKLPTFMREKIEKEEKEKNNIPVNDVVFNDKLDSNIEEASPSIQNVSERSTFKFPIDITDTDFVETRSRQSIHQAKIDSKKDMEIREVRGNVKKEVKKESKVSQIYKDKKKENVEEKKFRATPIISPIYGVLDKNYSSIDVESSRGENLEEKRHSKNVDFDSVRKKAYGSLTDDIKENLMCENCEYLKEAKECKKNKLKQENIVYDSMAEEEEPYYSEDITLDEATENYYDYGVPYEKKVTDVENNYSEEEVKIINHDEEKPVKKEIPPVKSSINLLSTLKKSMGDEVESSKNDSKKDLELTDDLFNLIDSMYDERNEG